MPADGPPRVLFLCTHNSARSQMAEGLLRGTSLGEVAAFSAGTVATHVRPEAIAVMGELGYDIRAQHSKTLALYTQQEFDFVITVCDNARETCPFFPNARYRLHWSIDDPASVDGTEAERLEAFRLARDDLRRRIETDLLPELRAQARRGKPA